MVGALGLGWGQTATPVPVPEKVDVCEVARTGAKYAGHYLEVTGVVSGLDPAHLLLTSKDCMFGVKLSFSADAMKHDDVRILLAAIKVTSKGGTESGISGTFEGRYLYSDQATTVGLQVEGIDHLEFPRK